MNVLLVGFGYVGSVLGDLLVEKGHGVVGLRRSKVEANKGRVSFFHGDAADASTLARIDVPVDQIVCATSPDARVREAYRAAYPCVVKSLLEAFPGVRILLVSSTAVYDQTSGETVDESAPAEASSPTASEIRAAERLLLEAPPDARRVREGHVVVRASGIYGPGRTRLVSSLLHSPPSDEEGALFTSRIHRDDLAGILLFLLERPHIEGVIHASDPHPARLGEIAQWAGAHLDRTKFAAAASNLQQRKNRRMMPLRLQQLGYEFRYPSYAEGYREILKDQWIAS